MASSRCRTASRSRRLGTIAAHRFADLFPGDEPKAARRLAVRGRPQDDEAGATTIYRCPHTLKIIAAQAERAFHIYFCFRLERVGETARRFSPA